MRIRSFPSSIIGLIRFARDGDSCKIWNITTTLKFAALPKDMHDDKTIWLRDYVEMSMTYSMKYWRADISETLTTSLSVEEHAELMEKMRIEDRYGTHTSCTRVPTKTWLRNYVSQV